MQISLTGKRAIVTGSTAGIGYAIAKGLAQAGAGVVINGRTATTTAAAKARLQAELPGATVQTIAADLGTAPGIATLLQQAPEADIVVNNLGIFAMKTFNEISDADWLRFFETNVMSGIRMARHYLPAMVQRQWGRVVFISSESAINIPVPMIHYGVTKAAQLAVTRGLAESVAGSGVTVNAVLPGPTRSAGVLTAFGQMSKQMGLSQAQLEAGFIKEQRSTSLIQRFAEPDEVANMVVYVCSPQASATTGAALRVEGGVLRNIG